MSLPRLPDWVGIRGGSGRASAGDINDLEPRKRTLTVSAKNALLPIAYGRVELPGLVFAIGNIGSDLVIGYLWCVGEIDAVEDVFVNDEGLPGSVTATHYTGTPTQGVDSTLESAITAYADTLRFETPTGMRGAAYSVLRIPVDAIDGWPRARAIVRGRLVHDPRTDTVGYFDNSALCLGDLITDPDYGLGMDSPEGLAECADWCDSLLGGVSARARLAMGVQRGRRIYPDLLDLLSEYAECWYTLDGPEVTLIPDQPVDLNTVPVIGADKIIRDSLHLHSEDTTDAPTEVEIRYTEPTEGADPWQSHTVSRSLEGVSTGEFPRIPTSVRMEAIFRVEEAQNKAVQRLKRQRNKVSVSWQTTDSGVVWQKGDVVRLDHPARGVDMPVRIIGVRLIAPGRYEVSAHRYDDDHYSDQLIAPEGSGVVPEGAITLLAGSQVPEGWSEWTNANGRFIVGGTPGETGGSAGFAIPGGDTTVNGEHNPSSVGIAGANAPDTGFYRDAATPKGGHHHAAPEHPVTVELTRRENIMIQKTGSAGITLPSAARVFGLPGLSGSGIERITSLADRYLRAASSNANFFGSDVVEYETSTVDDSHRHHILTGSSATGTGTVSFCYGEGGGPHAHTITASLDIDISFRDLPLYGASGTYDILPGTIFMWEGDPQNLPEDYVLCDGGNGTPDMQGYFVRIAGHSESSNDGSGEVSISLSISSDSHTHSCSEFTAGAHMVPSHSGGGHSHYYSVSPIPWTPAYYALAFIMYAPAS